MAKPSGVYGTDPIAATKEKAQPGKLYRGWPGVTVKDFCKMKHHDRLALDKEIDAAHGITYTKQAVSNGREMLVGARPGQSGKR